MKALMLLAAVLLLSGCGACRGTMTERLWREDTVPIGVPASRLTPAERADWNRLVKEGKAVYSTRHDTYVVPGDKSEYWVRIPVLVLATPIAVAVDGVMYSCAVVATVGVQPATILALAGGL